MTNDDKDLKPIFAGMKLLKMEYKDWVLKHSAHKIIDFQVDGFGFQRCYDCNEVYCYQDYFNLNTRPTPQQPSSKTAVQCSSCGHLDYIQQPSEPLKELDEKAILMVLDQCCPVSMDKMAKEMIAQILWNKFGQPSEKKALSVDSIKALLTTIMKKELVDIGEHFCFVCGEPMSEEKRGLLINHIAQSIFDALPARKEVKWPEKMAEDGESDISIYDDQLEKRVVIGKRPNKRLDAIWFNKGIDACIAAYEEAIQAQREVRYPEKEYCGKINTALHNDNCEECKYHKLRNKLIDKMKKLNGG